MADSFPVVPAGRTPCQNHFAMDVWGIWRFNRSKAVKLKILISFIAVIALLAGCAFDISHVKELPVTFTSNTNTIESFILNHDVKATLPVPSFRLNAFAVFDMTTPRTNSPFSFST